MKVLWITNVRVDGKVSRGGWLLGALNGLVKNGVEVSIAYMGKDFFYDGENNGIKYYSFPERNINKYDEKLKDIFKTIIKDTNPDLIHIWGTEYPHSLSAVNAAEECKKIDKTVISIQGLISYCSKVYLLDIPFFWRHIITLRDLKNLSNLQIEKKRFEYRGNYEIQALKKAKNVIGRTDWDCGCLIQINQSCKYYFCNEIMRPSFYESKKWDKKVVKDHRIFISQASYPIKGLHKCLESFAILKKNYPDLKIVIAGPNMFKKQDDSYKHLPEWLIRNSYQHLLHYRAKKFNLLENIVFIGEQTEKEMVEELLKSSVFVSASNIENSSNSISEAKLLGVPCVCSYVGGVSNSINHGIDGFAYPWNEPNLLAYYIRKVFEEECDLENISNNAIKNEFTRCNPNQNTIQLLKIYNIIYNVES